MSKEYPELLPCPFCGGEANRLTIGDDEPNNAGGDVIVCTRCQASSHVEFGRKENLESRWNTRHRIDGQEEMRWALADAADAALAFLTRLEADQERERPYDDIEACATDASDWQAKDLLCERDELRRLIRDLRCVSAKAPALHSPEEKDNG